MADQFGNTGIQRFSNDAADVVRTEDAAVDGNGRGLHIAAHIRNGRWSDCRRMVDRLGERRADVRLARFQLPCRRSFRCAPPQQRKRGDK